MAFDRSGLIQACHEHGTVARVVVAAVRGSTPREVGAAMLVWADGSSGTIGGGTLEHQAILAARQIKTPEQHVLTKHALGPDFGQCCGGAVDLLTEVFTLESAQALPENIFLRGDGDMPLAVARIQAQQRNASQLPKPQLLAGWMIEPVKSEKRPLWIWGAGHVGRALINVLSPLPEFALTWVDVDTARFPASVPNNVQVVSAKKVESLVPFCPPRAEHLIVTYSHDLDLELCHRLLGHGFTYAGLIGSKTKWARFRTRLKNLGHSPASVAQITCPIGTPVFGKHPHAIALGVGSDLLTRHAKATDLDLEGYA